MNEPNQPQASEPRDLNLCELCHTHPWAYSVLTITRWTRACAGELRVCEECMIERATPKEEPVL